MNLKPLRDRIVVKPKSELEKTKGGIYLPDTASKERPIEGEVIAVGTGKITAKGEAIALEIKKGDTVVFNEYAGSEVKIADDKYLIMREGDILAVRE